MGEHMRRERLRRGWLQKDLARLFHVDKFTVVNWERGFTKPQIKDIPTLISFLGYDPDPPTPRTIADHLYARRRVLGWSQKKAAEHVGVDPCTWSSWEGGGTIMKPEHRKHVAALTGLDESEVCMKYEEQWNEAHGKQCADRQQSVLRSELC